MSIRITVILWWHWGRLASGWPVSCNAGFKTGWRLLVDKNLFVASYRHTNQRLSDFTSGMGATSKCFGKTAGILEGNLWARLLFVVLAGCFSRTGSATTFCNSLNNWAASLSSAQALCTLQNGKAARGAHQQPLVRHSRNRWTWLDVESRSPCCSQCFTCLFRDAGTETYWVGIMGCVHCNFWCLHRSTLLDLVFTTGQP